MATYHGLIRSISHNNTVVSVEYQDQDGKAVERLRKIVDEAKQKWPVENIAFTYRVGKLKVGDINLVVAVAAGNRGEGFAACQYIINRFKNRLLTHKIKTMQTVVPKTAIVNTWDYSTKEPLLHPKQLSF